MTIDDVAGYQPNQDIYETIKLLDELANMNDSIYGDFFKYCNLNNQEVVIQLEKYDDVYEFNNSMLFHFDPLDANELAGYYGFHLDNYELAELVKHGERANLEDKLIQLAFDYNKDSLSLLNERILWLLGDRFLKQINSDRYPDVSFDKLYIDVENQQSNPEVVEAIKTLNELSDMEDSVFGSYYEFTFAFNRRPRKGHLYKHGIVTKDFKDLDHFGLFLADFIQIDKEFFKSLPEILEFAKNTVIDENDFNYETIEDYSTKLYGPHIRSLVGELPIIPEKDYRKLFSIMNNPKLPPIAEYNGEVVRTKSYVRWKTEWLLYDAGIKYKPFRIGSVIYNHHPNLITVSIPSNGKQPSDSFFVYVNSGDQERALGIFNKYF